MPVHAICFISAQTVARDIARQALAGYVYTKVGHSTHYHTDWVVPYWSSSLDKVAEVNTHLFFRWNGWWGTPPAFRHSYSGAEPVIAKLARLSPFHASGTGPAALAGLAVEGVAVDPLGHPIHEAGVRLELGAQPGPDRGPIDCIDDHRADRRPDRHDERVAEPRDDRLVAGEGGDPEKEPEADERSRVAGAAQFLIAIYGGYFGGGIGFLMMAVLTIAGMAPSGSNVARARLTCSAGVGPRTAASMRLAPRLA